MAEDYCKKEAELSTLQERVRNLERADDRFQHWLTEVAAELKTSADQISKSVTDLRADFVDKIHEHDRAIDKLKERTGLRYLLINAMAAATPVVITLVVLWLRGGIQF